MFFVHLVVVNLVAINENEAMVAPVLEESAFGGSLKLDTRSVLLVRLAIRYKEFVTFNLLYKEVFLKCYFSMKFAKTIV
jgi:hypothetical protein